MSDFPYFYVVGIPVILAALFYAWLKWLNWRDARPKKIPRHVIRDILRGPLLLALVAGLLPSCENMTPEERAALTKFALDTGTMARDKALAPKTAKAGKMKSTGKEPAPVFPPKGTERLFE